MVANVIEDYFAKPEPPGPELEQKLKLKMEAAKLKFEQNRLKVPVKDKTVNLMEIDLPEIQEISEEEKKEKENEIEAVKVITIGNQEYLCHKVKINDSLMKLSLKYNVSVAKLKGCNQLLTDEIF